MRTVTVPDTALKPGDRIISMRYGLGTIVAVLSPGVYSASFDDAAFVPARVV